MTNAQVEVLAGFDLDDVDAVQDVTHKCAVITDDEGNPVAGFILAGKNSEPVRAAMRANRIANMQRSAARQKGIDMKTEAGAIVVADTVDGNDRNVALAAIVGWFGFNRAGVPVTYDAARVPSMLDKVPTWQEKVIADLNVEANFMPGSSKG